MPAEPSLVAFHIGAHKTATSHLQRSLRKAAEVLAEQGVHYYGPDHFRLPGRTIPAMFGFPRAKSTPEVTRTPAEQMARLRKDGHRIVLSEENFIGVLNNPKGRAIGKRYGQAAERITELADAIGHDIDVFLGIRRPTGFINSAYCQMLMGGQVMPAAVFQKRNPVSGVDWLDLVTRLRAAKGVGRLTVWRHEDYARVFPQITAGLVGAEFAHHVVPINRRVNAGLSSAAVAEVLHRTAEGPVEKIGFTARKLLPVSEGYLPFDGFLPQEHATGDAAYAAQIAGIAALEGVTLLQPDGL